MSGTDSTIGADGDSVRRTLRSRLLVSFVLVAAGVLVVASTTTWLLVRGSAQRIARDELAEQAARLQDLTADLAAALDAARTDTTGAAEPRRLQNGLVQIARGLQVGDARLVFVSDTGEILTGTDLQRISTSLARREPELAELIALPDGVEAADLDPEGLRAGAVITGSHGSLVYRAERLESSAGVASVATVPVLVLTREADLEAPRRVLTTFLAAAAFALVLCAAVSAWLARRLIQPLAAAGATAASIAAGDLAARIPDDPGAEREIATLTATINRMAEDLELARGSERALLMSVSHDLRTPLTSIRGYAEALADGTLDGSDPEARGRAAAVITAEARRLERLVRDLLDLGRLDRREFSLRPTPCDAAAVVRETALGFEPHAAELGLALRVTAPGPLAADLDRERLGQIVANLTENALKYATSSVSIEVAGVDDWVVLAVLDDGPGIPDDQRALVFDRLHGEHDMPGRGTPGRAVGTGLGLSIVRELAHAMGGDARVEPGPGGGSRFVVRVARGPARATA